MEISTAQTSANDHGIAKDKAHTLDGTQGQVVTFAQNQCGEVRTSDIFGTINQNLNASGRNTPLLAYAPSIVEQAMSCKWAKGSSSPAGDEHHNLIAIQPNKEVGTLYASGAGMERPSGQPCESDMLVLASQQGGAEIGTNISPAVTHAAGASGNNQPVLFQKNMQVRRLTPKECERLQGFPDDYTAIEYRGKPAPDSARYKALGNSMAVPVMRWIGKRIDAFCNATGENNA